MSKSAVLFSGQGSQYRGMFREIYDSYDEFKNIIESASKILDKDIAYIMFEGKEEELHLTENTQPVVFCSEIALWEVLKNKIVPEVFAGFSLGEWSALVCAGVIPFEEALPLVQKRAEYMQNAVLPGVGAMAVVRGRTIESVSDKIEKFGISVSNDNYKKQFTVAGKRENVESFVNSILEIGGIAQVLPISIPSHCSLMQPAANQLKEELASVDFMDARIPVMMNATGKLVSDGKIIKENIVSQMTSTVLFRTMTETMLTNDIERYYELGPGKTLCGLVYKTSQQQKRTTEVIRCDLLHNVDNILNGEKNEWRIE